MFVRVLLVTFLATVLAWSVLAHGSEGAGAGQPYRVQVQVVGSQLVIDAVGSSPGVPGTSTSTSRP